MKHLVVVGGGISGLAAAQGAVERRESVPGGLRVTVLEREPDVGGKAVTLRDDGWCVEGGPTGYLDDEPALDRLVRAAGLEKLAADAASARRFLVRGGRMREIQAHPLKFATCGVLGPLGLLRLAAEPFVPARRDGADETVWDFASRRIGAQAADRMIAPMVLGVFAGDAKRLSLPAAFPKMRRLEDEHGSLIRGMIAKKRAKTLEGGPSGPGAPLTSFAEGLGTLPRALAERGAFDVRCGVTVKGLRREGQGFDLALDGETLRADAVVVATEGFAAAELLRTAAPDVAGELDAIPFPPVTVVALGLPPEARAYVPRGFGVLIPRGEGYRILGCLWDTFLFPGRSPGDHVLVRAMLGGAVDPEVACLTEDELLDVTRRDLARLFGAPVEPVFHRVVPWPRAIPQYELGHLDRVARVHRALAATPGLYLAGNALEGVAFGKSAATGLRNGEEATRWLADATPA